MIEGILGGSLIIELVIAYVVVQLVYEKMPNKWLYVVLTLILFNFVVHLDASNWNSMFSGNWDFVWNNLLHFG